MPIEISLPFGNSQQKKSAGRKWKAQEKSFFGQPIFTAPSQKANTQFVFTDGFNPANALKNKALKKTLKFRAVTLFTTLGITWILTGSPVASLSITAIQQSTNTAVYYFFEQKNKQKENVAN
ncbi:MAG: DUF2061 domain-containing protein [archaeon]